MLVLWPGRQFSVAFECLYFERTRLPPYDIMDWFDPDLSRRSFDIWNPFAMGESTNIVVEATKQGVGFVKFPRESQEPIVIRGSHSLFDFALLGKFRGVRIPLQERLTPPITQRPFRHDFQRDWVEGMAAHVAKRGGAFSRGACSIV